MDGELLFSFWTNDYGAGWTMGKWHTDRAGNKVVTDKAGGEGDGVWVAVDRAGVVGRFAVPLIGVWRIEGGVAANLSLFVAPQWRIWA